MAHTLTARQRAALDAFAAQHGRGWKAALRAEWERASASPELMTVRNQFGPSWLQTYKPASSSSSSSSSRAAPALPSLFAPLTARDWEHVREVSRGHAPGDEEAIMTSIGYIDVGKLEGGLAYVGGMSFDANGGGGLAYRKVMQPAWR